MTPLRERVARIIDPDPFHPAAHSTRWQPMKDTALTKADAAISEIFAALEEPTEEMIAKGADRRCTIQIGHEAMAGPIGEWPARDVWRAMLRIFKAHVDNPES